MVLILLTYKILKLNWILHFDQLCTNSTESQEPYLVGNTTYPHM